MDIFLTHQRLGMHYKAVLIYGGWVARHDLM